MLVDEIVAVAADVIALVDDEGAEAELAAAALGEDATADARADYDHVVVVGETLQSGEPAGVVVVASAHGEVHARPLVGAKRGHIAMGK